MRNGFEDIFSTAMLTSSTRRFRRVVALQKESWKYKASTKFSSFH
jgi:hypothetical protein